MTSASGLLLSEPQWEERIRRHVVSTQEAIVNLGTDLLAAKEQLGHGRFERMCERTGMARSAWQMAMAVAGNPVMANACRASILPFGDYTSLYQLSRLEPEVLGHVIEAGEVRPDMKRAEVTTLVRSYRPVRPEPKQIGAPAPRSDDAPIPSSADVDGLGDSPSVIDITEAGGDAQDLVNPGTVPGLTDPTEGTTGPTAVVAPVVPGSFTLRLAIEFLLETPDYELGYVGDVDLRMLAGWCHRNLAARGHDDPHQECRAHLAHLQGLLDEARAA